MSETKRTPGLDQSWVYDERGCQIRTVDGQVLIADVRGWGFLTGGGVAALGLLHKDAREIQDAWGRLIAAAPDLLEACVRLLHYSGPCDAAEMKDRDFARAAIDKAEGKS